MARVRTPLLGDIGDRLMRIPIGGEMHFLPLTLTVRQGINFRGTKRDLADVDTILVHDNAGPGNPAAYFDGKGWGVHFFIELDGTVWFHADPDLELKHGGKYNRNSLALEMRNGIVKQFAHKLQTETIKAKWSWQGQFTLYTPAQIRAASKLIPWLLSKIPTIPREYPGRKADGSFTFGNLPGKPAGIVAHHYNSKHADGSLLIAIVHGVIEEGKGHREALHDAARAASNDGKIHKLTGKRSARPLGSKGAPSAVRETPATKKPETTAPPVVSGKQVAVAAGVITGALVVGGLLRWVDDKKGAV